MSKALEILVVEDDDVDRLIIKRAIKSSGLNIEVSFAEDAESGMAAATGKTYDCIFLDYNLPGGTGLELLKRIKAQGNTSPIIIVTSQGDENIAVEAMKSGAVDYIPKSLMSGEGLTQSLRHVVRLKKAELEKESIERALRETEHQLHAVVSNIPIVLFALDETGVFTLFEGKGVEELSIDKNRIIGKNIQSFVHMFPHILGIFERAMNGEIVTAILELGEKFYQANYTPIQDPLTQRITGVIGVSYDVTEIKRAEEGLLSAKRVAEETVQLKEQFLANMSHEIRTPMNGIIGLSRILVNTPLNAEQQRYLNSIITSSDNLMVIINDILDLSKIEAGKMSFEKTTFRMEEVIQHSLELFGPKADEKNLHLITDIDGSIPRTMTGDPVRLGQILNNLVGNAIKFTNEGQVIVIARLRNDSEDAVTVDFFVKDTGIGIPAKSLETIFESFTQASSDTTRKFGGTGLGLTIVKKLVDLQGGSITVKSRVGEGTVFSFQLTFQKCHSSVMPAHATGPGDAQSDIRKLRILLAEDNQVNRMIVEKIFRDWEVPLDCAENGNQVLHMLQQKHYDLVLMDIQMPEMDGYEACRQIRQNPDPQRANIPVIALTAHAMASEKEKCLSFGMNDYLCKPFDPKALRNKIIQLTVAGKRDTSGPEIRTPEARPQVLPDKETILKSMGDKIDLTYLKEVSENNDEFIIQMIELFLRKTPGELEDMNASFRQQNWKELRMIAHRIKPSFNYMGATGIQKKLALIENYSETQSNLDKIEDLIQEVQTSSRAVFDELATELKNLK